MNKTAIEWCDYTWNPVTGCKHGCPYCYARKIAERFKGSKAWPQGFEPMFHPERLNDPMKTEKPHTIFVCSMADLFGDWVPYEWQHRVFDNCLTNGRHTYIFLTKNPRGMEVFLKRWKEEHHNMLNTYDEAFRRMWFGASVTCREDTRRIDNLQNRMMGSNRFISFEPLLGDPGPLDLTGIKQVIIGAQTNPFYPVQVSWVKTIEVAADRAGAKVFVKDSLAGRWPDREMRRELCWSVRK